MTSNYDPKIMLRASIIRRIQGGSSLQELFGCLSMKELKILDKNFDLIRKSREVSELILGDLIDILQDDYGIDIVGTSSGQFQLDNKSICEGKAAWLIQNDLPKEIRLIEFVKWARNLLFQEIRMNMWMRYIEHKRKPKEEKSYHPFGVYA